MTIAWAIRVLLLLSPLALVLVITARIFEAARTQYLPQHGPFWCIPDRLSAGFQSLCAGVLVDPPSLAATAAVSLPDLVATATARSGLLVVLATGLAMALGVPLGFWLAIHAPPLIGHLLRTMLSAGIAVPAFFVAFLLQVIAVQAAQATSKTIIPVFGYGVDSHLVIPVLSLALAPLVYVARLVAIGATDLNARDFVRTARAKGLDELQVTYRHIAPNMLGALAEAALGGLRLVLAGLVIVEYIVEWPGLGGLLLRAVRLQDLGALLAGVAVLGAVFLILERLVDVVTQRIGIVSG